MDLMPVTVSSTCPWDSRCWLVAFCWAAVSVPVVTVPDGGEKRVSVEKPKGGVRWLWDGWGRAGERAIRRDEWNNAADMPVISSRPWRLISQLVLSKTPRLLIKSAGANKCVRERVEPSGSVRYVICMCVFRFKPRLIKPKAQSWGDGELRQVNWTSRGTFTPSTSHLSSIHLRTRRNDVELRAWHHWPCGFPHRAARPAASERGFTAALNQTSAVAPRYPSSPNEGSSPRGALTIDPIYGSRKRACRDRERMR